jgi:hypothetical protein
VCNGMSCSDVWLRLAETVTVPRVAGVFDGPCGAALSSANAHPECPNAPNIIAQQMAPIELFNAVSFMDICKVKERATHHRVHESWMIRRVALR